MPVIRLVYVSSAREDLHYRDIVAIMATAAASNAERSITGMLCYGRGTFLQALEGERANVNTLYHRIALDPRHADCQLLSVEEITTRDFPEWSMKVVDWSDATSAAKQATLLRYGTSHEFEPSTMTGPAAIGFLRELAQAERELME